MKSKLLILGLVAPFVQCDHHSLLHQRSVNRNSYSFGRVLQSKGGGEDTSCEGEAGAFVHGSMATVNGAPPSKIGIGSCWKPGSASKAAIANLVDNVKPQLQLWLGDQIYGDTTDMNEMKSKYDAKKQSCDFRKFMESQIPVLATWDDHDYGDDNVVRTYPKKVETQQLFLEHFDIPETDPRHKAKGPEREGIYTSELLGTKEQGRVHVIMLDNRYHHSPTFVRNGESCDSYTTMLGEEQWQWLENELETVESEIVIIGSGLQVLPPVYRSRIGANQGSSSYTSREYCSWYGDGVTFEQSLKSLGEDQITGGNRFTEKWGEIPQDREKLLRLIQKAVHSGKTNEVILTSGDVHFGEILEMEIPKTEEYDAVKVREITASGFSQDNPFSGIGNPYRLSVVGSDDSNFGSIEINWESSTIKLALHTDKVTDRAAHTFQTFRPLGVAPRKSVSLGNEGAIAIGAGIGLLGIGFAVSQHKKNRLLAVKGENKGDSVGDDTEMASANPIFE